MQAQVWSTYMLVRCQGTQDRQHKALKKQRGTRATTKLVTVGAVCNRQDGTASWPGQCCSATNKLVWHAKRDEKYLHAQHQHPQEVWMGSKIVLCIWTLEKVSCTPQSHHSHLQSHHHLYVKLGRLQSIKSYMQSCSGPNAVSHTHMPSFSIQPDM